MVTSPTSCGLLFPNVGKEEAGGGRGWHHSKSFDSEVYKILTGKEGLDISEFFQFASRSPLSENKV